MPQAAWGECLGPRNLRAQPATAVLIECRHAQLHCELECAIVHAASDGPLDTGERLAEAAPRTRHGLELDVDRKADPAGQNRVLARTVRVRGVVEEQVGLVPDDVEAGAPD